MVLHPDDNDEQQNFEATRSFVEAFRLGVMEDEESSIAANTSAFDQLDRRSEKLRQRAAHNAKRKLFRQLGVYGDPNRARNECTREIAYLRKELETLTFELQVLRSQRRCYKPSGADRTNVVTQTRSAWQTEVAHERCRLQEVESENIRLRLALERQRNVARSLFTFTRKRMRQLVSECTSLMRRSQPKGIDTLGTSNRHGSCIIK